MPEDPRAIAYSLSALLRHAKIALNRRLFDDLHVRKDLRVSNPAICSGLASALGGSSILSRMATPAPGKAPDKGNYQHFFVGDEPEFIAVNAMRIRHTVRPVTKRTVSLRCNREPDGHGRPVAAA